MLSDHKKASNQMKVLCVLNGFQWLYLSLDNFIYPLNFISCGVAAYSMYKWNYLSVCQFEQSNTKQTAK